MVADRVVLMPGTRVGRRTVMGTGALGKRDTNYEDGSTWMGSGMLFCSRWCHYTQRPRL